MHTIRHTDVRRALLAALIVIPMLAATACGSAADNPAGQAAHAAATPSANTPTPAPASQTFTSRQYGFRTTLTKDWSETDAIAPWDGKELQGLSSPAFANITDPATDRTLAVAAARVAKGMKLAAWRAAMLRAAPQVCSESPSAEATTLDSERALVWTARCSDGYDVHKLAALHGRRGYMLLLASQTANDDAADQRIFDAMRRSFRFTRP